MQLQHGTNPETPLRIVGTVEKTDHSQTIKLAVIHNGKKVAEYNRRFRTSFAGEQSTNALIKLDLAVLQSTPTRLLFPNFWDWSESQEYPVSDFLAKAIHVNPRPVSLPVEPLKVSASNTRIEERLIPDDKLNLKEEICQWEQVNVRITRRYVHQPESTQPKQAGYWIEIRSGNNPPVLKYLQAPQASIYHVARIHRTVCTTDQIYVLASFAGVGKTDAEWLASLEKYSGPKVGRTPDEQRVMGEELKRVNTINERRIQSDFRRAWILCYSYDGELKQAASFTLSEDFPQHVDMLEVQQPDRWRFTGFDSERRQVNGRYMTFRTKDYEVLLERDE